MAFLLICVAGWPGVCPAIILCTVPKVAAMLVVIGPNPSRRSEFLSADCVSALTVFVQSRQQQGIYSVPNSASKSFCSADRSASSLAVFCSNCGMNSCSVS